MFRQTLDQKTVIVEDEQMGIYTRCNCIECQPERPEPTDLELVKTGFLRLVKSRKRKRKLQKRGEYLQWSNELNGWLWRKTCYPSKP